MEGWLAFALNPRTSIEFETLLIPSLYAGDLGDWWRENRASLDAARLAPR